MGGSDSFAHTYPFPASLHILTFSPLPLARLRSWTAQCAPPLTQSASQPILLNLPLTPNTFTPQALWLDSSVRPSTDYLFSTTDSSATTILRSMLALQVPIDGSALVNHTCLAFFGAYDTALVDQVRRG